MLVELDAMKLKFDYVLIKYNRKDDGYGLVIKTDYGTKHYLNKNVIVNTRPSDVTILTDELGKMEYVIAHKNRIVASWDTGLLP